MRTTVAPAVMPRRPTQPSWQRLEEASEAPKFDQINKISDVGRNMEMDGKAGTRTRYFFGAKIPITHTQPSVHRTSLATCQ